MGYQSLDYHYYLNDRYNIFQPGLKLGGVSNWGALKQLKSSMSL